ncbi:amidase family protein [Aeromicrobium endophyticum]|uniref:Amidase n=1 Tax=Aeromicrobium endophyticum TaxID=2292704 RepID=A0A371P2R6_9ACTN|nr:amidase family protein [Aeromicrobium endophyticum]REK69888.1 amidase [Aeromicrobium endophyticum]
MTRESSRRQRRRQRLIPTVLVGGLVAGAISVAAPSNALNTATLAGSQTWTVHDASFPGLDTGSVRTTSGGALQGYGGLRVDVQGGVSPLNGILLRGFGITYDGRGTFDTTQGVKVDGVVVQRNLTVGTDKAYGRFLDSFTNTTKKTVVVDVAFGGQLGYGTGNNKASVATTSNGDASITTADGWASFDTAAGPTRRPSATVTGTPGTAGALTRVGNFLRDPFENSFASAGADENNHPGFVHGLTIAPGDTVSLAQYVVTGGTSVSDVGATASSLLTSPDVSGLSSSEICSIVNFPKTAVGTTDAACTPGTRAPITNEVKNATQAETVTTTSPYDPIGKDITTLLADFESRKTNSQQVVRAYLDRIAAYDRGAFGLHSVLSVAPDAMKQARAADAARKAGDKRPLLGVPILAKDIIDTKDMPTTGGSDLFDGWTPKDDSYQVKKLREAGAIIVGKANLSRFAQSGHFSESHYGQVWNAFDPSKSSIGSSGGSAVAVASSFGAAALGTQTGDSLWGPSWGGSLYSLRGTDGMQSSDGTMPLTLIQDYVGFIAQSLPDLSLLLNASATTDNPADVLDDVANGKRPSDWRTFLKADALKGKVIGIPAGAYDDPFGTTVTSDALKAQFAVFEQAGATIKQIPAAPAAPTRPDFGSLGNEGWRQWFAAHPDAPTTLDQVSTGNGSTNEQQRAFEAYRAQYRALLEKWMSDNGADAVLYPQGLSDIHLNDTIGNSFGRLDPQSSAAGVPTAIFPAGVNANGTPIGFQLQGAAFQDGELLGMAYAYDTIAKGRQIPTITPALAYDADAIPNPVEPLEPIPTQPAPSVPVKIASAVSFKLSSSSIKAGKNGKVTVAVKASGVSGPLGTIRVKKGSKTLKTVTFRAKDKGKRTFTLPKLGKGKHRLKVVYSGGGDVKGKTSTTRTLRVK